MSELRIRAATPGDLPRLTQIYNHYVLHTPVTFDLEPQTIEQRAVWFSQFASTGRYRLPGRRGLDLIVGYAGAARFRPEPASAAQP